MLRGRPTAAARQPSVVGEHCDVRLLVEPCFELARRLRPQDVDTDRDGLRRPGLAYRGHDAVQDYRVLVELGQQQLEVDPAAGQTVGQRPAVGLRTWRRELDRRCTALKLTASTGRVPGRDGHGASSSRGDPRPQEAPRTT